MCSIHGGEGRNSGGHFGIFHVFIGAVLAEIFGVEVWHFANNLFVWRICCGGATAVGDIRFEREKESSQRTEAEAASRGYELRVLRIG